MSRQGSGTIHDFFKKSTADEVRQSTRAASDRHHAAAQAEQHDLPAKQRKKPGPKKGSTRLQSSPVKKKARVAAGSRRTGKKTNWWHPLLIREILRAVHNHGSAYKACMHLRKKNKAVYGTLDHHTVSAWLGDGETDSAESSEFDSDDDWDGPLYEVTRRITANVRRQPKRAATTAAEAFLEAKQDSLANDQAATAEAATVDLATTEDEAEESTDGDIEGSADYESAEEGSEQGSD